MASVVSRGHIRLAPRKVRSGSTRFRTARSLASAPLENPSESPVELAMPTAAYVHLPFCKRRCHYCDFPIVALGESSSSSHARSTMERYVDLVCREIELSSASPRGTPPLETVFFGGGTPSLIPIPLLQRIIRALEAKHGFSPHGVETSMEMDPGTFTRDYLARAVDECGINRVSLGVQAFDDVLLKLCGRSHCLDDVHRSIAWIQSTPALRNWSLDLISSLPHQTLDRWRHSLREAVAAAPDHVSIYDLQIEAGTRFANLYKPGSDPLPSDDDSVEFYRLASSALRDAGYDHYEISNFARSGFQCRHNLVYWKNLGYYAYGLGATSFVAGCRIRRSKSMRDYAAFVEDLASSEGGGRVPDSLEDRILDTVMLSLRLAEGIDLRGFEESFGREIKEGLCDAAEEFAASGKLAFLDERGGCVERASAAYARLTDPDGFLLSNEIISSIFARLPGKGSL